MVVLVLGRVANLALTLGTIALATRGLGAEGFGVFRTGQAFLALAVVLGNLGLHIVATRELSVPGADQSRVLANAMALRIVSATLITLLAIGVAWLLPYDHPVRIGILAGAIGTVAQAGHQLLLGLFQEKLRQTGAVVAELTGTLVLLALTALLYVSDGTPAQYLLATSIGFVVTLAVSWTIAWRMVPHGLAFDLPYWWMLLRASTPLAIGNVLILLYYRMDTVFLSLLRPVEEVGYYGLATRVQDSVVGVALLFAGLVMPLLSRQSQNPQGFARTYAMGLDVLGVGVIGVAVVLIGFATPIVTIIAGQGFAESALPLAILSVTIGLHSLTTMIRFAATAIDRQTAVLPGMAAGTAVALIAYWFLIPHLGPAGAALGTVLGESIVLLSASLVVRQGRPELSGPWRLWRAVLVGALCVAVAGWAQHRGVDWWWLLPVPILLYPALLLLSGAVPRSPTQLKAMFQGG